MNDAEKPTPESPQSGTSEAAAAPSGSTANVISIEQARAELLHRKRTPPKGVGVPAPRSRSREVPSPVTLPPGEHSAVIVTDTPAARAHVDKKTVHPGEAPQQTHDKKVRVKTSLDPRRQKTQVTDRRPSAPVPGEADTAGMWSAQPPSQPPGPLTASQPPGPYGGSQRPSLARPRPIPRDNGRSAPLFLIGVALAAALGAVVVFMLSRQRADPNGPTPSGTEVVLTAVLPGLTAVPTAETTPSGATSAAPATTTTDAPATSVEPGNTGAQAPTELPSAIPATPVKSSHSATTKPSSTASAPPTASVKPTATSILPFGKGEEP